MKVRGRGKTQSTKDSVPKAKPRAKAKVKETKGKAKAKAKPKTQEVKTKTTKAKVKAKVKAKPKARVKVKAKPKTKVKVKTKVEVKTRPKAKTKAKPKPRKSRKPKAVKNIFERRREEDSAPVVIEPESGATTQEEAFATIKARLEDAQKLLPDGLKSTIRVHPYADGSVDGQLQIKVPEDSKDTAWELMDSFGAITLGQRYWVSVGANYIIEADEQVYRRFRGMNLVQTNYQRAVKANIVEEGLILRKTIIPGMARKHKHEAHSVFIRLHWNPANEHPKR